MPFPDLMFEKNALIHNVPQARAQYEAPYKLQVALRRERVILKGTASSPQALGVTQHRVPKGGFLPIL